ncbi:MAG: hypothetical protein K9M81_03450 [Chthoniobacterales bacterium]|nr:hypothetical protein [Chthoniobacterales bacterium]
MSKSVCYLETSLTRIFHTKSITACGKLIITALVSNCDLGSMKQIAVVAIHHLR